MAARPSLGRQCSIGGLVVIVVVAGVAAGAAAGFGRHFCQLVWEQGWRRRGSGGGIDRRGFEFDMDECLRR